MNKKQKKLDESAINSTFEGLLDSLGEVLDQYTISGYRQLFKPIKPFVYFFQIIEQIEKELLVQWKLKTEKGFDYLFARQQNWLGQEIRSNQGFFFLWSQFCSELWKESPYHTNLIHPDPWKSLIIQTLTDKDLIMDFRGNILADKKDLQLNQLCEFSKQLYSISPYHLVLSFLNIIEIGVGTRPEIPAIDICVLESPNNRCLKEFKNSFPDVLEKNQWENTSKILRKFWQDNSGGSLSLFPAFLLGSDEDGKTQLKGFQPEYFPVIDDLPRLNQNMDQLVKNTRRFINKGHYHDVLLIGSPETGKKSSVLALINSFMDQGLRLIEIKQDEHHLIPKLSLMLKNKKERFIIFCNDVCFNPKDNLNGFKTFRGSVFKPAKNILFIVTSDLLNDTDKSDLSKQFGLKLCYQIPSSNELEDILFLYADRKSLPYNRETLTKNFKDFTLQYQYDKPTEKTVQYFIQEHSAKIES